MLWFGSLCVVHADYSADYCLAWMNLMDPWAPVHYYVLLLARSLRMIHADYSADCCLAWICLSWRQPRPRCCEVTCSGVWNSQSSASRHGHGLLLIDCDLVWMHLALVFLWAGKLHVQRNAGATILVRHPAWLQRLCAFPERIQR